MATHLPGNTLQLGSAAQSAISSIVTQPLWFQSSADAAAAGLFATAFAGFKWELPKELNLISLEYSTYTYYQEKIANSIVENQNVITVTAIRELSFINTYTTNIITNNLMVNQFKKYAKNGGLFVLITPAGIINNLALENLSVQFYQKNPNPVFIFTFRKLVVSQVGTFGTKLANRASFCI